MFLGGYTDLGGEDGDDKSQVSMDLDKAVECMMYYQSLNSFFALDADTITSDEIIQNFIDGKTVFAIANASMIGKLDKAIANGEIPEYPTERTVTDENGEVVRNAVVTSVAEAQRAVNKLQKENEELKAKLTEATLYAEDADKKIADLQKENEELKAAIQAQATMGTAAPVSEDSGKKKTTKTPKQSE